MATSPEAIIRRELRSYADRGIFRSFSEAMGGNGRGEFRFIWLTEEPFRLTFDARRGTLTFRDLLPGVAPRSAMDRELRAFLKEQTAAGLPAHRRIDPKRAEVKCVNRGGTVSVTLRVKGSHHAYGLRKIVNLAHGIFLSFLYRPAYYDYVAANFQIEGE